VTSGGTGAGFRCPHCGGRLEEQQADHGRLALACLRGHSFSADDLLTIFAESIERGEEFAWASTVQILTDYAALAKSWNSLPAKLTCAHGVCGAIRGLTSLEDCLPG
jgi:hypothetical protein